MKTLAQLRAARAEARSKLSAAAEALERGQKFVREANAALKYLETVREGKVSAAATQLADSLAANDSAALRVPPLPPDTSQTTARNDVETATAALKKLAAAHAQCAMDTAVAEGAVVKAVDGILEAEIAERSQHVQRLLDEALRLGTDLKYFELAAGIHISGVDLTSAAEVIARLSRALLDTKDVPINLQKLGDVAAFQTWVARRGSMIAADAVPEHEAA
jgi:hypothetical protein